MDGAKTVWIEEPDIMHKHINLWQAKLQLMKIKDVVNIW